MFLIWACLVYAAVGLAVALVFVATAVTHVLAAPAPVSPGARALLIPGAALLWPLVLARMWRTRSGERPR